MTRPATAGGLPSRAVPRPPRRRRSSSRSGHRLELDLLFPSPRTNHSEARRAPRGVVYRGIVALRLVRPAERDVDAVARRRAWRPTATTKGKGQERVPAPPPGPESSTEPPGEEIRSDDHEGNHTRRRHAATRREPAPARLSFTSSGSSARGRPLAPPRPRPHCSRARAPRTSRLSRPPVP
jgi:hypothetical protein